MIVVQWSGFHWWDCKLKSNNRKLFQSKIQLSTIDMLNFVRYYISLQVCNKNRYWSHVSLFSIIMDLQKNIIFTKEKATIEWVLCSPHFDDVLFIAPEGLNDVPINSLYKEIPMKQIKKKYFDLELPKTHCVKRKKHYTTLWKYSKRDYKINE